MHTHRSLCTCKRELYLDRTFFTYTKRPMYIHQKENYISIPLFLGKGAQPARKRKKIAIYRVRHI